MSRTGKFIETEKLIVTSGRGNGEWFANAYEVSFGGDENALKLK